MNTEAAPDKKTAPARWSGEEEARLEVAFKAGTPLPKIAEAHGRSVGAITARLNMLDLISYGPYTALVANINNGETEAAPKSGLPWVEEEIARLLVVHHSEGTVEALTTLAAEMGRTPRSLALKLVSLGAVEPALNPNPSPAPRPERKEPKPKPLRALVTQPTRTQKITVTGEFQAAAKSVMGGENILVLGSAGTGKSTFLRYLRKQLDSAKKRYVVLAPTGMAALNVGGQTIHSFFGFKPGVLTGKDLPRPRNPKLFEKLDVLILDEISMVRADMFDAIDHFLRAYGPHKKAPFGGVRLCLIGDLFQLPPIVRRDEQGYFDLTYASPYFFSSASYRNMPIEVIEFTHVFRQADVPFINLLSHIRHATHTADTLHELNRRVLREGQDVPDVPTLTARLAVAESANQRAMAALAGGGRIYTGDIEGTFEEAALPAPLQLELKPGAKVMFIKNDTQQRWVNGTLGTVLRCEDEFVMVKTAEGVTHAVDAAVWERTRFRFDEGADSFAAESAGSYRQIPLTLAWAITIHKCQGQTLPGAVVDLSGGGAFAEGQLYVALSRTRSLDSLYLKHPIQPRDVRTHPAVAAFYHQLNL
ncbi:MAG TPA: DEAD/DEAH box helicase [Alphaproteobacteria bacterium]|nr:DEAD/DEAH box helicase [Alphaproteobacteria bacterium]